CFALAMEDKTTQALPLAPYRALDLTDEKGLLCGKVLGDLGADVVKVERPGGDPARGIGPFYHDTPHPEKSLFWFTFNTSKRGITLNLECAAGQDIFRRLSREADFVLESFPPGYLDSLGLGYEALSQLNPRLIMTSITPFGQSGPRRDWKASDITLMALGGLMYICGDPDRPPVRVTAPQANVQAGSQAAVGSMIAHSFRERTGLGQHVDVSIQECIALTLGNVQQTWDMNRRNTRRAGGRRDFGSRFLRVLFPCQDGYVASFGRAGAGFLPLVQWMDEEGEATGLAEKDWMNLDSFQLSQDELDQLYEATGRFFSKHTKQELYERAMKRRLFLHPVNTPKDLVESPQLASRDYFVPVEHPELGESLIYPGAPYRSTETSWRISRRAPLIGEHNEEVYLGEMGFTSEELATLKQAGVI
ncbi:MAG: CoA transferase, partial [Chloroflexota bacterium]|nr:CoA transferase [Chloroflexota bacterium]